MEKCDTFADFVRLTHGIEENWMNWLQIKTKKPLFTFPCHSFNEALTHF